MAAHKNIPEIRFKGFEGEWEEKILGNEVEFIGTGKSIFVANCDKSDSNPYAILGSRSVIGYDCEFDYSGNFILTARVGENAGQLYKHSGQVKITDNTVYIKSKNLDFIFYLLNSFNLQKLAFGTGQPLIKASELNNLNLKFPTDTSEQTQIGTYFQKLDSLISLHQRKYDKLLTVKKGMLEKMFPKEGADVPEIRFKGFVGKWEKKKLDEIAEKVTVGIATSSSKHFINIENGVPFIKNQDIKNGRIEANNLEAITPAFDEANKTKRIKTGDILTVRTGYPGLSAVVPKELNNSQTFTTLITRLKANSENPEFITVFINSDYGTKQTNGMQAGGAQKNINANTLKNLEVNIPSIFEQNKIAIFFKNLDYIISQHQIELDKLKNLKKACLEKMFV